jgi:hypothetical protein
VHLLPKESFAVVLFGKARNEPGAEGAGRESIPKRLREYLGLRLVDAETFHAATANLITEISGNPGGERCGQAVI